MHRLVYLRDAAFAGDWEEIGKLVAGMQSSEIEALVNTPNRRGLTALCFALGGLPSRPTPERMRVINELLGMRTRLSYSTIPDANDPFLHLRSPSTYPLVLATKWNKIEALETLLTHSGVDLDDRLRALGRTSCPPLHTAVYQGNLEAAKLLFRAGAPVCTPVSRGLSAFGLALKEGQPEITRHFLEKGYPKDPTALEDGRSYVALAAMHTKSTGFIPILLGRKCDPCLGINPLVLAARSNNDAGFRALLRDHGIRLKWGHEVLEWISRGYNGGHLLQAVLNSGVDARPVLARYANVSPAEQPICLGILKKKWYVSKPTIIYHAPKSLNCIIGFLTPCMYTGSKRFPNSSAMLPEPAMWKLSRH